jgi:hypothetical protein
VLFIFGAGVQVVQKRKGLGLSRFACSLELVTILFFERL